jgi:HAD superfamily hydrolase (TIGR01509 family)
MTELKAIIFDVDGTLADTESTHLKAFNAAFQESSLDWHWSVEDYTELLKISGGKERIAHYWKNHQAEIQFIDGATMQSTIDQIHLVKTAFYESAVRNHEVQMRAGVLEIIDAALSTGIVLAIATTTSPVNIAALLRHAIGEDWRKCFSVVEDASTAPMKKPHPQVYLQTLQRLGLPAPFCLAIEDSNNGLRSALTAGLKTVITTNAFTKHHDFSGALQVLPDLAGIGIEQLQGWHQRTLVSPSTPSFAKPL